MRNNVLRAEETNPLAWAHYDSGEDGSRLFSCGICGRAWRVFDDWPVDDFSLRLARSLDADDFDFVALSFRDVVAPGVGVCERCMAPD